MQTIQSEEEDQSQKRAHTKNQVCLHRISGNHTLSVRQQKTVV